MKKNTYFMALNQGGQQILAFILIKFTADRLGNAGFGIYMFAAVMSYFVLLMNDLGLATYITREIAREQNRTAGLFYNAFAAKLVLLGLSVPFLGLYLYGFRNEPDKMLALLAFGVFGLFSSFNQLCGAVYRGHERMGYETAVTLFEKVLITAFGLWFVLKGFGVVALCAAFGGAGAASFLVNMLLIKKKFVPQKAPVHWRMMRPLVRTAFTFGVFWIITNIHERVDVLMLERMTNDAQVGLYTMAYKLILVAGLIPVILMTATFPRISMAVHNDSEEVARIYRLGIKYLLLIVMPMVVGVQFLARDLCLFLGRDFGPSGDILRILIFASAIDFFSIFFSGFLMAWNRQKQLLWLQCAALCLNVAANFFLIPHFGPAGAALATLASRGLIFALCLFWIVRKMQGVHLGALPYGVVSTGIMAIFLWVWHGPLLLRILLSALLVGAMLFLMGGIRPSEVFLNKSGPKS